MQAKLIVVGGRASKPEAVLTLPGMVGRSRGAGLTVGHPMVSRRHCEVYERDGLAMVRDLGSLNGTYVGGQRIREAPLPPGAKFTVGPLTFRVVYEYSGDLGSLPPMELEGAATAEFTPRAEPPRHEALSTGPTPGQRSPVPSPPAAAPKPAPATNSSRPPAAPAAPLTPDGSATKDEEELDFQLVDEPQKEVPQRADGSRADETAGSDEEEPDFELVEEPDDQPPRDDPPNPKAAKAAHAGPADPEDQALDDFLKGIE